MIEIGPVLPMEKWNKSSTYLLLVSPNKIPHLVLVHQGSYYSLTYKKSIIAEDFDVYYAFLTKRKYKILWVELVPDATDFKSVFEQYKQVDTSKVTCLQPIRNSILPNSIAEYVYELIPELQEEGWITNYYHTLLEEDLSPHHFYTLNEYTKEDIFTYIQQLNNKYVER